MRYYSKSHYLCCYIFFKSEVLEMRLKDIREDRDITQKEIAEYLNVRQNTYSQYENEKRQIPLQMLIKLAKFYNTSVDYLLGLTSDPKKY